ncbi:Ribosome-releasing factor 2, mitochondrial [Coemansia javaensis]|uniref:Elongation factor 2 n=1 Tax=Coemansia javaensis TaxID=2761396 RepID=A0A9W8H5G2_9FUNG|nr:Ribosome-releasing factor 2, mitochondrial [Coemansia javaensis]
MSLVAAVSRSALGQGLGRLALPLLLLSQRRWLADQPAGSSPLDRVRNIGIIAHIDAGKTTTTERMLHYAGFTRRMGDVDDGSTVMDYLPAERERGITIQSAAITFGWRGAQLHLIDTPGHVDFTVEVERAVRVLDGAVAILDAVAGVQAQTQTVWRQAARYGIPRLVFVNKMDRDGADWRRCVADVAAKLGAVPLVLQIPEAQAPRGARLAGADLARWLDVVSLERISFDLGADASGASVTRRALCAAADPQAHRAAARARAQLVDALAEVDARTMDVFLSDAVDGDPLRMPAAELRAAVRRATLATRACPVLLGAAFRNVGVQPLLDAVVDYLPAPTDRPPAPGSAPGDPAPLDPAAPLVALAFKVIVDAQRGPMVFVRVYSGTLTARMTLVNATRGGAKERATKLLQMYADVPEEIASIPCGHIGVVLGLKLTRTGDTLLHPHHPSLARAPRAAKKPRSSVHAVLDPHAAAAAEPVGLQLHGMAVPPPVFFCAVEADSPLDEKPLADALAALLLEDPSLHVTYDPETGQTLLSGMGELHLEVVRNRLLDDMKIRASFGDMRVSYRETPGRASPALDHLYAKEVAGRVGKAAMRVEVAPLPPAEDDADADANANAIDVEMPESLAPSGGPSSAADAREQREAVRAAIADGVRYALLRGPVLGFPVARAHVRVTGVRGFGDDVSTPAAFRACAAQALRRALEACAPVLLEPIARVSIQCPEPRLGPVIADLNGARHGRVLSLADAETKALDGSMALLAEAPLSAMVGYSSALRSLTAGTATFSLEVSGFGPMTAQQQQKVVDESRGY